MERSTTSSPISLAEEVNDPLAGDPLQDVVRRRGRGDHPTADQEDVFPAALADMPRAGEHDRSSKPAWSASDFGQRAVDVDARALGRGGAMLSSMRRHDETMQRIPPVGT